MGKIDMPDSTNLCVFSNVSLNFQLYCSFLRNFGSYTDTVLVCYYHDPVVLWHI